MRPRTATPLDHFAAGFAVWFEGMWFAWVGIAACIVVIVAIVLIRRARIRAHARVPHYKRETGPIPVVRLRPPRS